MKGTLGFLGLGSEIGPEVCPGLALRTNRCHSGTVSADPVSTNPNPSAPVRRRRRLGPGALVAILVTVGVLGMWAWVFAYHLGGSWKEDQPGRIADEQFTSAAEARCAEAQAQVAALPPPWQTPTPDERADTVDTSVIVFQSMVDDLGRLPVSANQDRINEWLADWQRYVDDRASYAGRLRVDPDTRFYVTQSDRDDRQITLAIDRLAKGNGMPSCATPGDLT